MEALTSLSTKVFANCKNQCRAISLSRALSRTSGIKSLSFPIFSSLNLSTACAISSTPPRSSSGIQVSAGIETLEIESRELDCLQTVNVKFMLQQECLFGERFLLVGDDPIIGSWDPSNAIPLNWSDGHLWTVEMEIPEDKLVQFKFLLKRSTGDVVWQPGSDRIIRTWKTKNTIVIAEDWEDFQLQRISEEMKPNPNDEHTGNQDVERSVSYSVTRLREELIVEKDGDFTASKNTSDSKDGTEVAREVEELISARNAHQSRNAREMAGKKSPRVPVLVPDFTPFKAMSNEETLTQ